MPFRRPLLAMLCALVAAALAPAVAGAHVVLPGETLSGIAAANGLSTATLAAANGITPDAWVVSGTTLTVPAAGSTPVAPSSPAISTSAAAAGGGGHLGAVRETLPGIAAAHRLDTGPLAALGEPLAGSGAANGLSPSSLASATGLSPSSFVIAGTRLRIPAAGSVPSSTPSAPSSSSTSSSSGASSGGGHLVIVGETLSGIAAANGLSTATLASANGLSPNSFVIAGTHLRIPAPGVGTATAGATQTATPIGGYRVRLGDTLGAIAAEHGVPLTSLASANGLNPQNILLAGSFLRLPAPGVTSTPVAAPISSSGSTPVATGGRLSASQISSIAAQHRVPRSLAAAVARQEDGVHHPIVAGA